MKISKIIKQLQEYQLKYGEVEVTCISKNGDNILKEGNEVSHILFKDYDKPMVQMLYTEK